MGLGTRLTVFLITTHIFLFFAGINGYVPYQQGQNPHQAFVNNITSSQFEQAVTIGGNETSFSENVGIAEKSLDGFGVIAGILTSPYNLVANTGWPPMIQLMAQIVISSLELIVLISFLRGVNF